MKISRRDFFAHSSGLLFSFAPFLSARTNLLSGHQGWLLGSTPPDKDNILVVIHLAGGNDWFNTIIPYNKCEYYEQRPNLAVDPKTVLKIDNRFAFNPALAEIKAVYDNNEVAVLLNCGSGQHDLSHQKAIKQLQHIIAADSSEVIWLSRYAEFTKHRQQKQVFPAINVDPVFYTDETEPNIIKSREKVIAFSLDKNNGFAFDVDAHYRTGAHVNAGEYIENGFTSALMRVAQLITLKENASIYHLSLGGFDTHENQLFQHNHLLRLLDQGIVSFRNALIATGHWDRVLIVICSEFGRTLQENVTAGTDHGYVNHALVIGKIVKGGIYGKQDLLSEQHYFNAIAYSSLWSTILDRWLNCLIP